MGSVVTVVIEGVGKTAGARPAAEPDVRCTFTTTTRVKLPRRPREALLAMSDERLPDDHSMDPSRYGERPYFMSGDRLVAGAAPYEILPAHTQRLWNDVTTELLDATRRVISVARWRLSDRGVPKPVRGVSFSWSLDSDSWFPLVRPWDGSGRAGRLVTLTDTLVGDIQRLLDEGHREPLAFDLWREAWSLRYEAPRSALLLAVAALETGVKQHISYVVPDAAWLAIESPAPPVHRLINEYLAEVHELPGPILSKRQTDYLKKVVAARNRLTHRGAEEVDGDLVLGALDLVRTTLRAFDALGGHQWALSELPPPRIEDGRVQE